jgi:hypothetical protein
MVSGLEVDLKIPMHPMLAFGVLFYLFALMPNRILRRGIRH